MTPLSQTPLLTPEANEHFEQAATVVGDGQIGDIVLYYGLKAICLELAALRMSIGPSFDQALDKTISIKDVDKF